MAQRVPVERAAGRFRVALLIETSNRYGRDLLHGVHDWVKAHGRWTIRLTEQARLAPLPRWLETWDGDGIIARVDSAKTAGMLARLRKPVVDVSAERERSEFPRVSIENDAVADLAFAHLSEKRVAHFAFAGDARFLWSRLRGRRFAELVRASGARYHSFGSGNDAATDTEAGQRELLAWVQALPKPVGIFACYDGRAQQVLTVCAQLGLAVPAQVAVLGVDNDEVLCELCDPPLSSIVPNARRAGFEAAAILQRLMEARGRRAKAEALDVPPVRVVQRHSTDLVSVADAHVAAAVQFIRAHACDGINVSDVLGAVPVSRTLLEAKFKQLLGHTPHEMIRDSKLQRARELLAESELPVARVADMAGFESPAYLSAVFRRQCGATPLQYRRSVRARA